MNAADRDEINARLDSVAAVLEEGVSPRYNPATDVRKLRAAILGMRRAMELMVLTIPLDEVDDSPKLPAPPAPPEIHIKRMSDGGPFTPGEPVKIDAQSYAIAADDGSICLPGRSLFVRWKGPAPRRDAPVRWNGQFYTANDGVLLGNITARCDVFCHAQFQTVYVA